MCGREMLTPKRSILPLPSPPPALLVPPPGQVDSGAVPPWPTPPSELRTLAAERGTERPSFHPTPPGDCPLCPEPTLWPVVTGSAEQARLIPAGPRPVLAGT